MAVVLNNDNFADTIKEGVVLVDFWAEWCGPCQQMLPILEEFTTSMEGKMLVGKVDVDSNQELAAQYRVMSIPTLIVFKDGEMVEQMTGVQTMDQLNEVTGRYM